ncbi:germ cell-specific gene 1 protein isoform X4 [Oncorhynchus tshawytscha]|uniref:germ cell-specific gene 1 protein isoform X4 n=1 Tax=Oncorhynchus tshawytscha TaxID=74940 RepID=UPI000D09AACE|nr:germ cell-specific gene 1 protein isoform X4 [Oncorhynchus tshawytscha]XP_042183499.1 germ cell-specific gene 1 protein isoform X4 [Oncorhynchus tshawytscha]XP_042183500.1 germ cell-specific gene 1 protein isoform X4 [Oncorhynchus tshawytscha]XP_042183501.1 germ cell-specific gene 1 protein isoform X4 [Oncorhynchus tshawytscha]
MALLLSYWCEGSQKVPKPLCSANKLTKCIPVPGVSHNSTSIQFSWETGDDRFVFPAFHAGMWMSCEENIYTDAWEEKCRSFLSLTPGGEKVVSGCLLALTDLGTAPQCLLCSLHYIRRVTGNGGSQDVHAGVSDYCLYGSRGLQTTQLWLLLGLLCGMAGLYLLHVVRSLHPQQLHQED